MHLPRMVLFAVVTLGLTAPTPAATLPDGHWKLTYQGGANRFTYFLIKTDTKDGKLNAVLASSARLQNPTMESATVEKDELRLAFKVGATDFLFVAALPKGEAKSILGTMRVGTRAFPGELTITDATELKPADAMQPLAVPPLQKATSLTTRPLVLRQQAAREQDAEKKAQLLKDATAAAAEAKTEIPKLYAEVMEKHADSPGVLTAGLELLRTAGQNKVPADKAKAWAAAIAKAAQPYGPLYQQEIAMQLAEILASQDGLQGLALEYAQQALSSLEKSAPPADHLRVYKPLASALRAAKKEVEAKEAETQVARLEAALDKEYLEKVPPFKPESFTGRKGDSNRVAVMELFTGAQCPPCVAADVAFDALGKSYRPKDLVLIQYHLHIPGPDPLTNADTVARAKYYGVNSTPSTFFNGKAEGRGGGAMANAEKKYDEYRGYIDPLLEKPAGAQLRVTASRQGQRININAAVADLAEPGDDVKLRLLLVEESIRYVGSNNLRFHHQVVRALPGGVDGLPLKEKETKHQAVVELPELTKQITSYLDDFAKQRPFPNTDRPLDFKHLRVIALVQNDKTKEILQAVQVELGDETAAK